MTLEDEKRPSPIKDAPAENFSSGNRTLDLSREFGDKQSGKVWDFWTRDGVRVMFASDRKSSYDVPVGIIEGTGTALSRMTFFWKSWTRNIMANDLISSPNPNILIVEEAEKVLPVEIVWRSHLEESYTLTSLHHNYFNLGRRKINGFDFPDGLVPNQELPMGPILTPTTKAKTGHDKELTLDDARDIVDSEFGEGTWDEVVKNTEALFETGRIMYKRKGILMTSTKYEVGRKRDGSMILIDEVHTSDSSRLVVAGTYGEHFERGEDLDHLDKELLRRYLEQLGFTGEGMVPVLSKDIKRTVKEAYGKAYFMLSGKRLPVFPTLQEVEQDVINYFEGN